MAIKKTKAAVKKTGKTPAKKTAAKKVASPKTKAKGKRGGFHREINPDTGFVVGTDQDTIALALLEGGDSRADIAAGLEKVLDNTTRSGTEKQITNMVSGVLGKMLRAGFTVESSFAVVPPTPASKRAATRAASKLAEQGPRGRGRPPKNVKTVAKKTAAKGKAAKSKKK